MKTLAFIHRNDARAAIADFSPVLSVLSWYDLGATTSPFLLLDHIGPGRLMPHSHARGVHDHPHRGFETVTIVYDGEIEHRDSAGGGGRVGPGDVQWMTAARGVVHREFFSEAFRERGGRFEMLQLWVNLPARDKLGPPAYQNLTAAAIPVVALPAEDGQVRVIAGRYGGVMGPARTHTRINVLDVRLRAGGSLTLPTAEGDTALVYLLSGRVGFGEDGPMEDNGLAVMSQQGAGVTLNALEACRLLFLSGERIDEPINGHGPFVMNTYEEILQAYEDVKAGRLTDA